MRALLFAALLAAACGGSSINCPNDLPPSCPSPMPSYKNDVAPIIQARCLKCHSPGGQEAVRDYTTYQGVYFYRQSILTRVHDCTMPPQGESPPDSQERALLFGWLVCGAPNN